MSFRISTWNCFGMGQGFSALAALRAPFSERFRHKRVLAECALPDILCVQELLSRDAQRFFDSIGEGLFTSRIRDCNRIRFSGRMTMRGSGLGIGARLQLREPLVRTFAGARVGWDRLARKGALYTQLSLAHGVTVDLITVHLQAGYDASARAARAAQLSDLRAFVDTVGSRERPIIVCGDFNIDGLRSVRNGAQYRALAAALDGFEDLGAAGDLSTFDPRPHGNALAYALEPQGSSQRIDYIFFRPGSRGPRLRCTALDRFFDRPLSRQGDSSNGNGKADWASDHYGLSATFE